ncbi:effector-associated domain EAD1-containing protein [Floridanema evergladense]|uniref:Effector-associated domain EAD1-containing protein n=1 Tax=Floridaenema evergladense BLCC-F167 TaxID=3153639 RepID=A0ABV4WRT4_9CYAN
MGLNGEKRKNLREALIKAYPKEADIQLMLEDQLDWSLSNIKEAETYGLKVQNIIRWAEAQGKLRELIIGASQSNPGNQYLRDCVGCLLIDCFDDIDDNLLATESLISLIKILKEIQNQEFTLIKKCCEIVVPEISDHRSQMLKDIQNNELDPSVKLLILLNLLLKEYKKKSQGMPYIIEFVMALQRTKELQATTHQALFRWLKQVHPEYPVSSNNADNQNIKKLQGHLLIFVRVPITSSTEFLVQTFLCIKTIGNDDSVVETKFIDLPINNEQGSQRGIFCNLSQIEENLLKWEEEIRKKLDDHAEKMGCWYDLTIEFFLPYDYLATPVEQWKVNKAPIQRKRRDPVGKKHQVVVRSVDRLDDSELFNQLLKTWQHAAQILEKNPTPEMIQAKIEQLDCPVGCDWDALTRSLKINQQIALKLTCAMPNCTTSNGSTNLERLFESILEGGTPIVLWSRQCNLSDDNVVFQMDGLLTLETLCNLDNLLEQVKTKRIEAGDDRSLGHHLAILCDEPKWLRQVRQFLRENPLRGNLGE